MSQQTKTERANHLAERIDAIERAVQQTHETMLGHDKWEREQAAALNRGIMTESGRLDLLLSHNRFLSESDKAEVLVKIVPAIFVWPGTGSTVEELLADPQTGLIIGTTSAADRMFAYEEGELLGQPIEMLMPERFRERHKIHFAGFVLKPIKRLMGTGDMALFGIDRDSKEFPIEIALEQKLVNRQKTIVALPQYARKQNNVKP